MISLLANGNSNGRRISRRDMLRLSSLGGLGLALPHTREILAATRTSQATHAASAKRCIFIFLCGGPSQLDMWDPKPLAPDTIRGPFSPISTNVPGFEIGDLLPLLAQQADKFSIIRSMTHDTTVHDIGILYALLADSKPPSKRAYPPTRTDHPGLGAILRSLLGDTRGLPAWVTVPRPFTTGSRFYKGQSGGFLGPAYDPFFLNEEKKSSLADKEFRLDALQPPETVDDTRMAARHDLLKAFEANFDATLASQETANMRQYYERAFSMISSEGVRTAFDLSRESQSLRDKYGRNEYGQSFLMARRLAESGVRMTNVFWTYYGDDGCQFNLWDNHGSDKKVCGGYNKGVDMIRGKYCCPAFDRAFSALLEDLADRGMLDDTLVVATGEFGRTPKINKNAGRDHWGACYSTVVAGGGIRGGQIYGASDRHAAFVKNSPVAPEDLGATILHAFGFPPEAEVHEPTGRPVRSSKGRPVTALF
jgi:hypothetical protein